MRRVGTLEVLGIEVKQDRHYMYIVLLADIFPLLGELTFLSEINKQLADQEIHSIPVLPPTIRSFN